MGCCSCTATDRRGDAKAELDYVLRKGPLYGREFVGVPERPMEVATPEPMPDADLMPDIPVFVAASAEMRTIEMGSSWCVRAVVSIHVTPLRSRPEDVASDASLERTRVTTRLWRAGVPS